MVITKIEQQKKNKKRYSIFIDNEFKFGMIGEDVLYLKLRENKEITQKEYDYILENVIFSEAKQKATRYLGYGPRTKKEMIKKLNTYEYPENVILDVIDLLERYNYINDTEYAKTYIEERIKYKSEGMHKIKYALGLKGISPLILENVLEEVEVDPLEPILKILEKKYHRENEDPKEKQRVYNYLVRKGFSYDDINHGFRVFLEDL